MIVQELVALLGFKVDPQSTGQAIGGMEKIVKYAKMAAVAYASFKIGDKLHSIAVEVGAAASEFSKISMRSNIAAEDLQKWGYVAKMSGTSLEAVGKGLRKLTLSSVQAGRGNKAAAETFGALGVQVKDSTGKIRPASELLPELADAFAGMDDEAKASAYAVKLFGLSGTELLPMLRKGSVAIREEQQQLVEMNGVMDQDLIQSASRYSKSQKLLAIGAQGLKNAIAKGLLPGMSKANEAAVAWYKANAKWLGLKITNFLRPIGDALGRIKTLFWDIVSGVTNWVKHMDPLQKKFLAIGAVAAAFALILALPAGSILLLIGLIALLIDDFQAWREGGKSVIGDVIKWFQDLINQIPGLGVAFKAAWGVISGVFGLLRDIFFSFVKFFLDWFEVGFIQACKNWGKDIARIFGEAWDAVSEHIQAALQFWWDLITGVFTSMWGWITDTMKGIGNAIVNAFSAAWDAVVAGAKAVIDLILAPWRMMFTLFNTLWTEGLDGVLGLLKTWAQAAIDFVLAPFRKVKEWIGKLFGGGKAAQLDATLTGAQGIGTVAQAGAQAFAPAAVMAGPSRSSYTLAPSSNVSVQVNATPGMNEAELAAQVAKHVSTAIENENRMAMQSLMPAAAR